MEVSFFCLTVIVLGHKDKRICQDLTVKLCKFEFTEINQIKATALYPHPGMAPFIWGENKLMKTSVMIIGSGPVGMRAAQEIAENNTGVSISIYGDKPYEPYNRVLLSPYLAGMENFESIRIRPRIGAQKAFKVRVNSCYFNRSHPPKPSSRLT